MTFLNNSRIALLSLIGLLAGAGCAYYKVPEIISYQKNRSDIWRNKGAGVERINPYAFKPEGSSNTLYSQAIKLDDAENARIARNRLQTTIMTLSDKAVATHLSRVTGVEIDSNILMGGAALAAAGEAALGPPATAKTFAQVAAGLIGFRGIFNDQVYKNTLVQSLVGSIISDRNKCRAQIQASQSLSITNYPADQAIADASDFHSRGSFYYGLTLIRDAAEAANITRNQAATNAYSTVMNAQTNRNNLKALEANPAKKP